VAVTAIAGGYHLVAMVLIAAEELDSFSPSMQTRARWYAIQMAFKVASCVEAGSNSAGLVSDRGGLHACMWTCTPVHAWRRHGPLYLPSPAALPLRRRGLLQWEPGRPSCVLIIKKIKNKAASDRMLQIGRWLAQRGIKVLAEPSVCRKEFAGNPDFAPFTEETRMQVDFCITLGVSAPRGSSVGQGFVRA
jgi:hypothetical protein